MMVNLLVKRKHIRSGDILNEFEVEDHEKVLDLLNGDLKNVLKFDDKKGYHLRHRFGPKPKPVQSSRPRFSQVTPKAVTYPDEYTNPDISNLVPLDQDAVGDCVGCSGANFSKLLRFRLLKIPTPAFTVRRNTVNADGITVDVLPDDTVSAAGIYCMARAHTNPHPANDDDGAQVSDAAEVITQEGIVPEWMWPTGKDEDAKGVPIFYFSPPSEYATLESQQVSLYKFGGQWAPLDGVNGDPTTQIQEAVTKYGGCWMAMPVFDNYGAASPSGDFPDPLSTSAIIGYHALCLVGWIRDSKGARRWQFVNSWEGYTPLINTISDIGYMQPYFKAQYIQLISVMPASATAFTPRILSNPLPAPVPTPTLPAITEISPASGSVEGGTSVNITGSGFSDVTGVKFGSTPAGTYTAVSETLISSISPPSVAAGLTNITVTTQNGTTTDTNAYLYTASVPVPSVGFWENLISEIVAFFESIFGKKSGKKPASS